MRIGIKLGYVSSITTTISYLTLIGGLGSLSWILVFYHNKGKTNFKVTIFSMLLNNHYKQVTFITFLEIQFDCF